MWRAPVHAEGGGSGLSRRATPWASGEAKVPRPRLRRPMVGYRVAPEVARVTATILSADSLARSRRSAATRPREHRLRPRSGRDPALCRCRVAFVLCRVSAHHWPDRARACARSGACWKPRGAAIFMRFRRAAPAVLDTFLQTFEMLRDPSACATIDGAMAAMGECGGFSSRSPPFTA